MKYQSLVSSTTPSDLQEWLGQELEDRGIDSVYARSILSLLQQDCVDIDPWECQHLGNQQLRYCGTENLYTATKLKHQKWKKWNKQILVTSNSCCKAVIFDWERMKKEAAVECLRSASDYVNDIEELIDKVCIKLKNYKNLNGDKDAIHLRNVGDQKRINSFFIPPSSPTDDIKKYFAAFPPLNNKFEKTADKTTDIYQHNIIQNVWCGVCVMQRNPKSHISKQCCNSIIAYNPPKQIKTSSPNIESTVLLDYKSKQTFSLADLKINRECLIDNEQIAYDKQMQLAKYILKSGKGSWKAMYHCITKTIVLPLEHLVCFKINECFLAEISLLLEENNFYPTKLSDIDFYKVSDLLKTLLQCNVLVFDFSPLSNLTKTRDKCNNLVTFQKIFKDNFYICSNFQINLPVKNKVKSNNLERNLYFNISPRPIHNEVNISVFEHSSYMSDLEYSDFKGNECDHFDFIKHIGSPVSNKEILTLPKGYNKIGNTITDISDKSSSTNAFGFLSKRENVCKLNPDFQFCEAFETIPKCYLENLSSNIINVNNNEIPSISQVQTPFAISKLSSGTSLTDFYIPSLSVENVSNKDEGELNLKLKNVVGKQFFLSECVIDCKKISGQKLLKKALFINRVYLANSPLYKEFSPLSLEKLATFIPQNNTDLPNFSIISKRNEFVKSKNFTDMDKYNESFQHSKIAVQNSAWPQQRSNTNDEMWLLYWGDNHNFISHTWQKDHANVKSIKGFELLHESEVISALSKEIREDGDELLRGLDSIPSIVDDTAVIFDEMLISERSDIYSDSMDSISQKSNNFVYNEDISLFKLPNSQDFIEQDDSHLSTSLIDNSFTISDIKSDNPDMLQDCASHNQLCYNALEVPGLSAFPNSYENVDSMESDYYAEDGGWSFASDSFLDYSSFINPYERSCSLDDLDLENSESGLSEFLYQKRMRCTSETDDDVKQFLRKQNQTQFQKRLKQKITTRKRPCCFFLQGSCTRSDCKFSHDLSTTTCRFWKEGSCFKGTTCPFLHGYIKESDKDLCKLDQFLQNQNRDHTYSLESEADFPSLSSAKTEPSSAKSAPIDIIQMKRREKL